MHTAVTYMTSFTTLFQPQFRNLIKMKISQKTQQHKMIRKMKQKSPCLETLQTRRQISKIHENMGHPSNRTLVRVLRLGGAKRRLILAAARH